MLDYRLRLWAPTSALRAISAIAKLLVTHLTIPKKAADQTGNWSEPEQCSGDKQQW